MGTSTTRRAMRFFRWIWLVAILGLSMAAAPADLAAVQRPFATLKPQATIRLGKTADWVAVAPDGIWVGTTGPEAVHRIDPATAKVTADVPLPGKACAGLALGFGSLWVPLCAAKPALAKIDLATAKISAVYGVGAAGPEAGIAASTDSIWLVTDKAGSLARIDPATGEIRQTVAVPPGSVNPHYDSGVVWVTDAEGAVLTAIDAATGALLGSAPTGPHPRFLTSGGGAVWTLNQGDGSLTRIDMATRRVTATVALGTAGPGGDIGYGAGIVWTTYPGAPLTATDAATGKVIRQWVGPGGDSLGVAEGSIWLTDLHAGAVSRIRMEDALGR